MRSGCAGWEVSSVAPAALVKSDQAPLLAAHLTSDLTIHQTHSLTDSPASYRVAKTSAVPSPTHPEGRPEWAAEGAAAKRKAELAGLDKSGSAPSLLMEARRR